MVRAPVRLPNSEIREEEVQWIDLTRKRRDYDNKWIEIPKQYANLNLTLQVINYAI